MIERILRMSTENHDVVVESDAKAGVINLGFIPHDGESPSLDISLNPSEIKDFQKMLRSATKSLGLALDPSKKRGGRVEESAQLSLPLAR